MPLNRFVADGNTYTFPATLGAYSDNFGDTVPRTTRLPGVDGGFDEFLSEPAAREIGSIRQAFTLQANSKEGLDALKDDVREMMTWGKGDLFMRPSNHPTQKERRVRARVSNIQMPKDEGDARTLYWQRVTVIFQVNYPIWEEVGAGAVNTLTINHSGTQTDGTATNGGNAIALPTVTVETTSPQVLTQPWYIRRMDGSTVLDEFQYNFTLPGGTAVTVTFDCGASSIVYDDGSETDGYSGTLFDMQHPDWLRLMPGAGTIRVVSGDAGDAATVTVTWRNAYY